MSDYKLVPVEPTAEMMATGGIEMGARDEDARTVWKAMIAAAPAVQGEAVAVMYEDGSLLSKADCGDNFEFCCKVLTPLYAAPQPTEQQPDILIGRTVSMDLSTGDHDACHRLFGTVIGVEGRDGVILCELQEDNHDIEQQPDVAQLVEALVACARASSAAEVGLIVDAALAAHRKQQGGQP